jgi:hypothetical protein
VQKPVAQLTLADLDESPVWEFVLDAQGKDEPTVRPHELSGELDPAAGTFVIRARFRLAAGAFADGYLTLLPHDGSTRRAEPVIITPSGHVAFSLSAIALPRERVAESCRRLGEVDSGAVFPIYFLSVVPLSTGAVSGQIHGFGRGTAA